MLIQTANLQPTEQEDQRYGVEWDLVFAEQCVIDTSSLI